MCCYIRHLRPQLAAVGLSDDRLGRREADRRVRTTLAMEAADCPDVWRRVVKSLPAENVVAVLRVPASGDSG